MSRQHAFSRIELTVILTLVAVAIVILLPALGAARRTARGTQRSTQCRGIHQALIIYAQSNGKFYPGLGRDGRPLVDHSFRVGPQQPATNDYDNPLHPAYRFRLLLEESHFAGMYAISPNEVKKAWSGGPVTIANYSYALLNVPPQGARWKEWRQTGNPEAVALSDREVLTNGQLHSIHHPGSWRGTIIFNDNSQQFVKSTRVDTRYGNTLHKNDDLFTAESNDDAAMTYGGIADYIDGD